MVGVQLESCGGAADALDGSKADCDCGALWLVEDVGPCGQGT